MTLLAERTLPRPGTGPFIASGPDELIRAFVVPGTHVHAAATMSRPNALINAVARVFAGTRSLTLSTTAVHSNAHALALSGAVRKVITGFLGDTYPAPRPNRLYRDVASGQPFEVELWSLLSYTQRLMAAALGQPYATTGSMLAETDLRDGKDGVLHTVPHPEDPGRQVTLMSPLRPDFTLFHGVCADRHGNVVACPPLGEGAWSAYAARDGVLASVEAIVDDEVVAGMPDRVVIPAARVRGLCEAPLGAHPQSLRTSGLAGIPGYLDDYSFLTDIVRACKTADTAQEWYETWVGGLSGHDAYLDRLGKERRDTLRLTDDTCGRTGPAATRGTATASGNATAPGSVTTPPGNHAVGVAPTDTLAPPTEQEQLIVLGARAVADLVAERGYDTVLAGIGASHMAAWLGARLLAARGIRVEIAAELGLQSMDPVPGDVFLFSQRHAGRSRMLAGIPETLGGAVAANPRCLGVLGAAEIDEDGNINTTVLPTGRWITGSGGANDIASAVDCLVVAQAAPRRYVTSLAHLTSPGHRVRDVVSQFGRFTRPGAGSPFRLTRWLPPLTNGAPSREGTQAAPPATPAEAVRRLTSWRVPEPEPADEKPVTPEELTLLRSMDPEGHYR